MDTRNKISSDLKFSIQANYRQQQQYDDIALKNQEISFWDNNRWLDRTSVIW